MMMKVTEHKRETTKSRATTPRSTRDEGDHSIDNGANTETACGEAAVATPAFTARTGVTTQLAAKNGTGSYRNTE